MSDELFHVPVLLSEVLELLNLGQTVCRGRQKPIESANSLQAFICVDATLGGGGHAEAILEAMPAGGKLIGLDRDPEALEEASKKLSRFGNAFVPVHSRFSNLDAVLDELGVTEVDAVFADLGVSLHQLTTPERGFSLKHDGPLDMRMDPSIETTAGHIVNNAPRQELARIFRDYGEEKLAERIASAIVERRGRKPFTSTLELAEFVTKVVPARLRKHGIHPATKVFQALRIAVNGELEELRLFLPAAIRRLRRGGRLCVISYHSLEDRLVKQAFREAAQGCICPPSIAVCVCGRLPSVRVLTPRPVVPRAEEVAANPRSRSAKARAVEKL
ncbi:MAG: 16S rRNA (cytosine(1402)-N(4))-methyltransferase RsmH [Armatimonadota bacterium]